MMKRVLIAITEDQEEWLREIAYLERVSKAEIIRDLIKREMYNGRKRDDSKRD